MSIWVPRPNVDRSHWVADFPPSKETQIHFKQTSTLRSHPADGIPQVSESSKSRNFVRSSAPLLPKVLVAVQQDGRALKFAAAALQAEKEVASRLQKATESGGKEISLFSRALGTQRCQVQKTPEKWSQYDMVTSFHIFCPTRPGRRCPFLHQRPADAKCPSRFVIRWSTVVIPCRFTQPLHQGFWSELLATFF